MGAKKDLIHSKKGCGAIYDVMYNEANIPYLQCSNCGHKVEDWLKWNLEYKNFWQDDSKWKNKQDHMMCLLGYFVSKYKEVYEFDFTLSLNEKGLFRGQETNILRRIYQALNSDAEACKQYINWYFLDKVQRRKKRLTSISVLATPALLNEFKLYVKKQRVVSRDKKIPTGMHNWIRDFAPGVNKVTDLNDYGDLHSLMTHYRNGHMKGVPDLDKFVEELVRQKILNQNFEINNWSS